MGLRGAQAKTATGLRDYEAIGQDMGISPRNNGKIVKGFK